MTSISRETSSWTTSLGSGNPAGNVSKSPTLLGAAGGLAEQIDAGVDVAGFDNVTGAGRKPHHSVTY